MSDCKIGLRGHGMAFEMEVIVSIVSGWCIKKVDGNLNDITIGSFSVDESCGEMTLTMSPVRELD